MNPHSMLTDTPVLLMLLATLALLVGIAYRPTTVEEEDNLSTTDDSYLPTLLNSTSTTDVTISPQDQLSTSTVTTLLSRSTSNNTDYTTLAL